MGFINILLIALSVLLIIFVAISTRRHKKQQDEFKRRFLDGESAANNVRKKEIDAELFFIPDLSKLPEIEEGDPFQVERTSKRRMIKFLKPTTNLELKMQYGRAQMDVLALYEENFNEFLKSLTAWAGSLVENGNDEKALTVLKYAITHGSEYRNTYKYAADIYLKLNDVTALNLLREKCLRNHFNDSAVQQHVVEYIESNMKLIVNI